MIARRPAAASDGTKIRSSLACKAADVAVCVKAVNVALLVAGAILPKVWGVGRVEHHQALAAMAGLAVIISVAVMIAVRMAFIVDRVAQRGGRLTLHAAAQGLAHLVVVKPVVAGVR